MVGRRIFWWDGDRFNLPIFTGHDPKGWIFEMERYFWMFRLTEEEEVDLAIDCFEEFAMDWYQWEIQTPFYSWRELKGTLLDRFSYSNNGFSWDKRPTLQQDEYVVDRWKNQIEDGRKPIRPDMKIEMLDELRKLVGTIDHMLERMNQRHQEVPKNIIASKLKIEGKVKKIGEEECVSKKVIESETCTPFYAVLVESGAPPPLDLFADINSRGPFETNELHKAHLLNGNDVDLCQSKSKDLSVSNDQPLVVNINESSNEFLRSLSASKEKDMLLKAIAENQIVVVFGEAGWGKATPLSQYILESKINVVHGVLCLHQLGLPDTLVVGAGNDSMRFIDVARGQKLHLWSGDSVDSKFPSLVTTLCSYGKMSAECGPPLSTWIASGRYRLFATRSGKIMASRRDHNGYVTHIAAPEVLRNEPANKEYEVYVFDRGKQKKQFSLPNLEDKVDFRAGGNDTLTLTWRKGIG